MNIQDEAPDKTAGSEEPSGQNPATKNAEWLFYWDGSVAEKETKARAFFSAARSAMVNEFKHASPGCMVLEYEDLAQAHYHVMVFFERYPVGAAMETAVPFTECVLKYGGPRPDNVVPYRRPPTTMEKWLENIRQGSVSGAPGTGGSRIAETYVSR
jgi:hypothetical protein